MSSVVVGFGGKTKHASSLSACRRLGQKGCAATGASSGGQASSALPSWFGGAVPLGVLLAALEGVLPCRRGGADGAAGSGCVAVATEASSTAAGGLAGGADDSQPKSSRLAMQATAWRTRWRLTEALADRIHHLTKVRG